MSSYTRGWILKRSLISLTVSGFLRPITSNQTVLSCSTIGNPSNDVNLSLAMSFSVYRVSIINWSPSPCPVYWRVPGGRLTVLPIFLISLVISSPPGHKKTGRFLYLFIPNYSFKSVYSCLLCCFCPFLGCNCCI